MEELDIDKYSVMDIKKLFTKNTQINFLNDFTLQDLDDAKKKIYFKNYNGHSNPEKLQNFLDKACEKVIHDKFSAGLQQTQGVVVKNTVRDTLNVDYKNTIHRLILIDSQYRPNLNNTETNYTLSLDNKIVNAVSIEIINLQIPYTFYNIESRQFNNSFTVTINGTTTTVTVPDGHYDLSGVLSSINSQLSSLSISFSQPSSTTGKITITNNNANSCTINFMPTGTKVNTNLGWCLGFRSITGTTLVSANESMTLSFTIAHLGTLTGTAVASVPITKYFVVVIDDFNKNQTADTMIQTRLDQEIVKPTSYFTQDPFLDYLKPDNVNSYLENVPNRTLTKAQIYTRAQQNQSRNNLSLQNLRLEINSPNQVLGVYPFDSSKMNWGATYFTDKSDYKREYHGPVDIEKLQIRIYDDKGILLNLNGGDWHMTLMTENLYKY
jgi:hypothetical protein